MKKRHFLIALPYFLALSLVLSLYFYLEREVPKFSILNHSFEPRLSQLLGPALITFLGLFGLWALYSSIASKLFSLKYGDVLVQDYFTYVPLFLLALAPLAVARYIDAADLAVRLKLFGLAALLAVFYLKLIQIGRWIGDKKEGFPALSRFFSSLSQKKKMAGLFLSSLIIFNLGTIALIKKNIYFSGDEVHYLLISHSLLHDGDFDLANNYAQKDYNAYMPEGTTIRPHAVPIAKKNAFYSVHSPGVSFLLFPFYALGSLVGKSAFIFILRLGMSLWGALFCLQLYLFCREEWKKENLALSLWFLASFTTPIFFYSIHVYPEIVIAFFSLTVYRLIRHSRYLSRGKILLCGFLLSCFIWFHAQKYATILAPLFIYCLWMLWKKHQKRRELLYFFVGPVFMTALYFSFQYSLYGSLSLSAISWKGVMSGGESLSYIENIISGIPLRFRLETLAGYFFDQRDGLLFYAPLFFFAFLGMIEMAWRKTKDFFWLLFLAAPYVLSSAFLTQRSGYAPQARPLVAVFWSAVIFLGYFLTENRKKVFSCFFSGAAILSFLVVYLLLLSPSALYQETTSGTTQRAGSLFLEMSNLHFQLPNFLPSYLKVENGHWLPNSIWLGVFALFIVAYVLVPRHYFSLKFPVHVILATVIVSGFFVGQVYSPRITLINPVRAAFPSGERLAFHSLSYVARMVEPGRFHLLEDNRFYNFYFTSRRKIEKLKVEFGSTDGDYGLEISFFDKAFYKGGTAKELRTEIFPSPPFYRFKNSYLYRVTIYLENRSRVLTPLHPYVLAISPVS